MTIMLLALAPGSAVAGPTLAPVTAMVAPATLGGGSTLEVTAGPFASASTLPSAIALDLGTGFSTATNSNGTADSTVALCSSVEEDDVQCPPGSQIGSGSLTLTADPLLRGDFDPTLTVELSFFLGAPRVPNTVGETGCTVPEAATVEVVSALVLDAGDALVKWPDQAAIGDLCEYGSVLNLMQNLPAWSGLTEGSAVTVDKLSVSLGPSATGPGGGTLAGDFTQSFLTNPDTCPGANAWGGGLELFFPATATPELAMDLSCGFKPLGELPGAGTLSLRLKAVKVSSPATFNAAAVGPFLDPSGRPTLGTLTTQKGFSLSTMAVADRCTDAQGIANACPVTSRIGTGSAVVGLVNAVTGSTTQTTVPLTIFLGRHLHGAGSSVITVGRLVTGGQTETESGTGDLSMVGRRVALNLTAIPSFTFPAGVIAEIDHLKLAIGHSRSVTRLTGSGTHRHRATTVYSLIGTPARCRRSWTVSVGLSFPDEPLGPYPLGTSCPKPPSA